MLIQIHKKYKLNIFGWVWLKMGVANLFSALMNISQEE